MNTQLTSEWLTDLLEKFSEYKLNFRMVYPESKKQLNALEIVEQSIKYDLMRMKEWEKYIK